MFVRDAWVEIDKKKLIHNFLEVKNAIGPETKFCAVLKAQCCGMDCREVARIFDGLGADMFAAAVLSEALEIREAVPDKEILILGYLSEDGYDAAIHNDISLTMYRTDALRALDKRAGELNKKARVHIKVNTGMNRIGFAPTKEAAAEVADVFGLKNIEVRGIFTHLACADEKDDSIVRMQVERFDAFLDMLTRMGIKLPTVHISASPAVCSYPELDRDMVRPGLLFTGYYTSDEVSRDRIHLEPCIKLKARLGNVMTVKKGEGVGYGYSYHTDKDTAVGLLPIGFTDGFTRAFSNNFFVTIRGIKCPVIGNICMDHCMIDVSDVPDPEVGEEITVYGDGTGRGDNAMNIEEVAALRGTIVDEVLTNLSKRLPRKFVLH